MTLVHQAPGTIAQGVAIDQERVLQALNLNPRDPKVQALILVCQQYGLDPVLKHAVLISGNLYVTRDGLLSVAHRSGDLDGIVVDDEGETADEWWAKVSVYRKGVTHPFTYRGRYPKSGQQKRYGPEMAVKCAEVMALRRAFGVTGIATVEEQWEQHDSAIDAQLVEQPNPDDPPAPTQALHDLVGDLNTLPDDIRKQAKADFVARFGRPDHLRASQLDDAIAYVDQIVAGPGSRLDLPGDGDAAPPEEEAANDGTPAASTDSLPEASPPASPELVDVPSFVDDPHPATRFHGAVKDALPMLASGATDSDLRHAVVARVTEGASEDWRTLSGDSLEAAVEVLTQVAEGSLVMHRTALGFVLRDARDDDTEPPLAELRRLIAQVPGLGEARALIRAKRLAQDNDLAVPTSFEGLASATELLALLVAEVRAEAEKAAA